MRLARQLELGSLVLFTDSKSVAKQLATMPASVAPCDGSQAHSPKRLAMDAAVALEAAGCRTTVQWVPRSQNKAHRLAARALEAGRRR
ncbi:hypothetical protein FNF27_05969 [Cafeteria roenbergensis]|uniref:Uncharacterized protein n=1 Tax=Cafeteria roenbergensis TaxID=33653 RepID=A0A5A8E617_CAFRO|nr:hypothetical protein FNF27_05969 [Cafeteria roenbergensis]